MQWIRLPALNGLDYANQRYYSSVVGRFLSPDPYGGSMNIANPQSFNRYSYAADDPVNDNDPTGLVVPDCDDLLSQINQLVFGGPGAPHGKGLIQRFYEQWYGLYLPGSRQWLGHNEQIGGIQRALKKLMTAGVRDCNARRTRR
jgi:RHS repeat-associated protein